MWGYFCLGWVRAAAAEARSQVAASQMMIKDRKVFILFIHYSLFIHSIFGWWGCQSSSSINWQWGSSGDSWGMMARRPPMLSAYRARRYGACGRLPRSIAATRFSVRSDRSAACSMDSSLWSLRAWMLCPIWWFVSHICCCFSVSFMLFFDWRV